MVNTHGDFVGRSFSTIFTSFFEFLSNVAIVSHTITIPSIMLLTFDFLAITHQAVHLVSLRLSSLCHFSAMSNTADIPNKAMTSFGKLFIVFSLFCL